jgi:hypothetical protein
MIEFKSLTKSAACKIQYEIVKTVHNHPEVLEYIKSGKADYFGFDENEELERDQLLFRSCRYAEFMTCTDYLATDNEVERIGLVQYVLGKLESTFRDLQDEKVLKKVREYISIFTNSKTKEAP